MLEALLATLHNWFEIPGAARCGEYEVVSGVLDLDFVAPGQFYRIEGSIFNDGLHQHPAAGMMDETFRGTIVPLAVPGAVVMLSQKIAKWCEENPETDKVSESFGGYSYSRNAGEKGWKTAFAAEIHRWKKVG